MTALTETASAKVNLSLRVLGRRLDGYHELESIVAFATVSDELRLEPGLPFELEVDGPFRTVIDGENLVSKAVRLVFEASGGRLKSGRIRLTKNLPVAAGLGGGSADAAAVLRLLQRANPAIADTLDWAEIALKLGADVPVCLASRAALMTGIGERLSPITRVPPVAILLVNPRLPLSTTDVFHALAAPPVGSTAPTPQIPAFSDFEDLIRTLAASSNDLEHVARKLCPAVGDVLQALAALPGARLVRMSGSGPTCFALFATLAEADTAGRRLSETRPEWWAAAGTVR